MPKRKRVQLNGSSYTIIRASIPCHSMVVYEDATRAKVFNYKIKKDSTADGFTTVFTTKAGDAITLLGPGRSGILGKPPNFVAEGQPATVAQAQGDSGGGEQVLLVKTSDDASVYVIVEESESEL